MSYVSEEDMIVGRRRGLSSLNGVVNYAMKQMVTDQLVRTIEVARMAEFYAVNKYPIKISKSDFRMPISFVDAGQDAPMQRALDNGDVAGEGESINE